MQTELIFQKSSELTQNSISYEQAKLIQSISELKEKYEKDREAARYLAGKKRGAWGLTTEADKKRSNKLDSLRKSIIYLESKLKKGEGNV